MMVIRQNFFNPWKIFVRKRLPLRRTILLLRFFQVSKKLHLTMQNYEGEKLFVLPPQVENLFEAIFRIFHNAI